MPILLITKNNKNVKKYLKEFENNHQNIYEIKPEEKEFSIKQIKNLIKETAIFNKNLRIYLLEDFHLSSLEAQNSFLKLLEEPPNNVLFVLTTNNEEKLIPTIRSRTKIIHLEKQPEIILDQKTKVMLNNFIESKSFKLLADKITLDEIIIYFREKLGYDKKAPNIIKEALKLKTLLDSNNLNGQLTIDHMLIFIKKQYTIK